MSDEEDTAAEDAGRQRRVRQSIIVIAAVILVFAGLFVLRGWLNMAPTRGAPPPTGVVAAVVTPMAVPDALEAVGTVRAVREVMLAADVAGRVTGIRFGNGQYVRSGTTLVQIFDSPERADRAAAVARREFARQQVKRARELVQTGAESRETLEQRRSEYDQAKAAVAQFDARLVQKRVVAPFSGHLGVRRVNLGQYLNPGDEIASLTDLSRLYVDFSLPQQDLSKLKIGQTVEARADAWPDRTFSAKLITIEPRISDETRNIWLRAELANPDEALRPGMYVNASLRLPPLNDALVVPVTAIQTSAQGDSVIAIRGKNARSEGKAEAVSVSTGLRFGDAVVITKGLRPGDVIVTEGQLRIQPGSTVKVTRLVSAGED
jgi:multidrug efflux system membrane fusion protein